MTGDAPDDLRAALAELERRLARLEAAGRREARCPTCATLVPEGRFCAACGAPFGAAPRPAAPRPTPAPAAPATFVPVAPAPAPLPPPAPAVVPAPKPRANVETLLGQRWAPRAGAVLVFLGVLFFLGVAIQRGWIGPLAQLALAAVTGVALVAAGGVLTAKRGYGTYPQILEGTGASILYVTAFVAHALPYYEKETRLTEVGSGLLMAGIALATVGLALWRDARVIAALGYGLAFITAILGVGALPSFTLPYVAILGTSLAVLVARKGWVPEALVGSLATGALLLWLAAIEEPSAQTVALVSLAPAAAFLWLCARPSTGGRAERAILALLVVVTFAWASVASVNLVERVPARGAIVLVWAVVAAGHAALAVRQGAPADVAAASGIAAVTFWLVGAPLAWSDTGEAELLTTMTYALGAMAVGAAATSRPASRGLWLAAMTLAGASALYAVVAPDLVRLPWAAGHPAVGPWQSWVTLALVAGALAPLVATRAAIPLARRAGFWMAALFGIVWAFALFGAPLLTTAWLLALAAAAVVIAIGERADPASRAAAVAAAFVVLVVVVLKTAVYETHAPPVRLDAAPAALQAVVVGAALLALHELGLARGLFPARAGELPRIALVGASAVVFVNWAIAYTPAAWPSILAGAIGVAYLAAGLARRTMTLHRYTGFGVLGFVLVRIFVVDMQETDLAIRALVFAVLGGILLGIGYVYSRISRRETNSP